MLGTIAAILAVILVFGITVFVHELGHYLMARLRGVGVEAFAIGMGPKIYAWTSGGTEYSIRWLPIGGFVRLHEMIKEDELPAEAAAQTSAAEGAADAPSDSLGDAVHKDMAALHEKDLLTKYLVFGGGVFFNFLTAIAAYALFYSIGFKEPLPPVAWVGEVNPASAAAQAGLQTADTVIEVEGTKVEDRVQAESEMVKAIERGAGADGLDVKVARAGAETALKLPPLTEETRDKYLSEESWIWELKPIVGGVIPFKPAAKAGIKEDDLIVAINGEPVERWTQLTDKIQENYNKAIELAVKRGDEPAPRKFYLVPAEDAAKPGKGVIGIVVGTGRSRWIEENPLVALAHAPKRAWDRLYFLSSETVKTVARSTFREVREGTGGPLAIMSLTYAQAQKGFRELLDWFITFNLLLMFFNLLPIPVLDGGFIVISTIEALIRRPVPARIIGPVYTFFALCFIAFFLLVSYQDILNTIF